MPKQWYGFIAANGDPLAPEEAKAITALRRLAEQWPASLTLASMGGALHVIHTGDPRYDAETARLQGKPRCDAVLETIDGIPNDGGDW